MFECDECGAYCMEPAIVGDVRMCSHCVRARLARAEVERDEAREHISNIADAWRCSDGGGGGVESIGEAIDAARASGEGGE